MNSTDQMDCSQEIDRNDMVSDAYIGFMHRRVELSSFVAFYHGLAKKAIGENSSTPDLELHAEYLGQSAFFIEMYVCKMSEMFDLYLEELTCCVCDSRPSFLEQKNYDKARSRLLAILSDEPNPDEIILNACSWFARKSKQEIADHYFKHIGFDFTELKPHWENILTLSIVRNQIVHGASIVDDKFMNHFEGVNDLFEIGPDGYLLLNELPTRRLSSSIDAAIELVENKIDVSVPLRRRNRFGHFWMPRSAWNRPEYS